MLLQFKKTEEELEKVVEEKTAAVTGAEPVKDASKTTNPTNPVGP